MSHLLDADATELARRIRAGETTAAELVDAAIDAIERVNPQLNAAVHTMYEQARAAARGPLPSGPFAGVPMAVKDFDGFVQGVPFTASTRFLDGFVPDHDAEAIARLRRAGLIFVAKTNCPELAILGTTESQWRGAAHHPWNLEHTTGGSSGGSAALVAARAVPVAHGGDGGGSLRIPGSACGVVGFKSSRGRIPTGPDLGEGWGGYVQFGVLSRSIRDTAALLDVMAGPMPGDPYAAPPLAGPLAAEVGRDPGKLRVAFTTKSFFGKATDPACAAAVTETAQWLRDLGHEVEEATPSFDRDALVQAYLVQVGVGVAAEIDEMAHWVTKTPRPADFEPATWFLRQVGQAMTGMDLQRARDATQAAGRQLAAFHQRYDVLVSPTLAHPPVRLGELGLKAGDKLGLAILRGLPLKPAIRAALAQLAATNFEKTPNTQIFNQTGQPAVSLPLHTSPAGLPIGVQFSAAYGQDALLIQVAAQLEAAQPWIDRKPPVCAL
ncbi:MAG: amidase [Deltaproteobacteria bacterium]|nr:amidase [Deltaproteobacteria bacterium]